MGKGERTRAAVIEHALSRSSRVGLGALTLGDLARDVGLSKSGLFAHCRSKEDLQLQVLEEAVDRFIGQVVRPAFAQPRGEARVRALFDRWLEWAAADFLPGGCLFVSLAGELDDQPGAPRDLLVAAQTEWLTTLATAARGSAEAGHFRRDLDPEQFAYDFYAILLAFHHLHRLLRDPTAEARARASFERLLAASR